MSEEIRVYVVDRGRRSLYMRYTDPITGKAHERSAGTRRRKDAEREAAKWEADLREGRYKAPSKVSWEEFRDLYELEVLPGLAEQTAVIRSGVFNAIEKHLGITKLAALNAERIGHLQRMLREAGRSENTIAKHMAHLKAVLNWAKRRGMIHDVPHIERPRRAKGAKVMKGRPITLEEFERMLGKVESTLFPDDNPHRRLPPAEQWPAVVDSWKHLLRGLWWSGLRLDEALHLWWDDRGDKLAVDSSGRYVMLRIPAEREKGHRDRLYPVAPEFAEFLLATPEARRTGPVFDPLPRYAARSGRLGKQQVGRTISDVGKAAGVKVQDIARTGKVKYASAHDLRRSFGQRWAPRVMPQTLMELMRHDSIETTLKFYVERNAETTAAALYAAIHGDTFGDTPRSASDSVDPTIDVTL